MLGSRIRGTSSGSGLTSALRKADAEPPNSGTAREVSCTAEEMQQIRSSLSVEDVRGAAPMQ